MKDLYGTMDVVVQRPTDTWAKRVGEARVIRTETDGECPKCGREKTEFCEIAVENRYLKGGKGTAIFGRCTQCDWESEAMARAGEIGLP